MIGESIGMYKGNGKSIIEEIEVLSPKGSFPFDLESVIKRDLQPAHLSLNGKEKDKLLQAELISIRSERAIFNNRYRVEDYLSMIREMRLLFSFFFSPNWTVNENLITERKIAYTKYFFESSEVDNVEKINLVFFRLFEGHYYWLKLTFNIESKDRWTIIHAIENLNRISKIERFMR